MATFFVPPGATGDGYEVANSTGGPAVSRLTVPEGSWIEVGLRDDTNAVAAVTSSDAAVSPATPARTPVSVWEDRYSIYGEKVGSCRLEARGKPTPGAPPNSGPVQASLAIQVIAAKPSAITDPSLAVLSYRTKSLTRSFGDFEWQIEWVFKDASPKTNGYIVKQVTFLSDTTTCDGKSTNDSDTWYEAWRVRHGRVFSGNSTTVLSLGDGFRSVNTTGSKGTITMSGVAKFIQDYKEAEGWGTISNRAGSLPATRIHPPKFSPFALVKRTIKVEYDSCRNPKFAGPMTKY